jgi:hypothetical protein
MLDPHLEPALPGLESKAARQPLLAGLRVMLVAGEPLPTRALCRMLETAGAIVAVVDVGGTGMQRARELDPQLVVVDPRSLVGTGSTLARRLEDDPRLRWASVARIAYRQRWRSALRELLGTAALVTEPDRTLRQAARAGVRASVDLGEIGPTRAIRAIERLPSPVCLTAMTEGAIAEIVLAGEIVVSASWWEGGAASVRMGGVDALAAFVTMRRGELAVRASASLTAANVLSPVGEALRDATQHLSGAVKSAVTADVSVPALGLDWDEADETTTRLARDASRATRLPVRSAQPAARVPVRTVTVLPPPLPRASDAGASSGPGPEEARETPQAHVALDANGVPVRTRVPESLAPVSIGRREAQGPPGLWAGLAAAVLIGAVTVAVAMQPAANERRAASALSTSDDRPARPITPTDRGDQAGPATAAADDGKLAPSAPAGEAADSETAAGAEPAEQPDSETAAGAEPGEQPDWLDDLPRNRRRAARELVERARARGYGETAERIYRHAHELDPRAARPFAGLAEIHLRRGALAEAEGWAALAAEASPRRASYRVLLGDVLAAAGDLEGARGEWREADRLAPGRANIRRRLNLAD